MRLSILFLLPVLLLHLVCASEVTVTPETLSLKTYELGQDEVNPLFRDYRLPGYRVSRGSRSCYPYPLQDKFQNESIDKDYEALILENELIKVVVIPELRGRIHGAFDKRNGWDFLYYNNVIKPADISVRQGWIAGGLEPNHPGGHGYTQFTKISHIVRDEPDGGKTIVIAEIEPVRMMKWEYEITLRPGKLYLETTGRLIGVEPFPIQFCSSQNAAMHATEKMEVIYPDGTYITGHGKRGLAPWPINDGIDYSKFENTFRHYSVFTDGLGNFTDYYGCYSHEKDIQAGTVIVADHRTVPGKKYFSWGNTPHGRSWDTLLSDEDGPYIELQSQAYWDNLGYGYAWLNPMDVKEFTIYWYPVMKTKGFQSANRQACVNLKIDGSKAFMAVQATESIEDATIRLFCKGQKVFEQKRSLSPESPWTRSVILNDDCKLPDLRLVVTGFSGEEVIAFQKLKEHPSPPRLPNKKYHKEEMTVDELYHKALTYYHDPFQPQAESYLQEILKRDKNESRAHRMLGVFAYQQGKYDKAKKHLDASLINDHLNQGYEANLYLGLVYKALGDLDAAKKEFTVASRHQNLEAQALYHLAEISLLKKQHRKAIAYLKQSVAKNGAHPKSFNLLAIAYRLIGDVEMSQEYLNKANTIDPLNFVGIVEAWVQHKNQQHANMMHLQFDRNDGDFTGTQLYVEMARFYLNLELADDAADLLEEAVQYYDKKREDVYPMINYYLGYAYSLQGENEKAKDVFNQAAQSHNLYVNPYRVESVRVLEKALNVIGETASTHSQLASLYAYLRQHEKAHQHWTVATKLDPENATVLRNLANVSWLLHSDKNECIGLLEQAHQLNPKDVRIFMELNALYDSSGKMDKSLALLEENKQLSNENDEVRLTLITLYLRLARYKEVIDLMDNGYFSATEFIANRHARYSLAHLGYAEELLGLGKAEEAIKHIDASMIFPAHLSEGEPGYFVTIRQHYLKGKALQMLGESESASNMFKQSINSLCNEPSESMYYKGLAYQELGMHKQAHYTFYQLAGLARAKDRSAGNRNPQICYMTALANKAQGHLEEYDKYVRLAEALDPDYLLEAFIDDRKLNDTGY